ncbi:MAG: hypothetical protein KH354_05835 [Clostridiales bacterium]|nr:hypothetical protein [Clostridiales bacterium]
MLQQQTEGRRNAACLYAYLRGEGCDFQVRAAQNEDLFFFSSPHGEQASAVVSVFSSDLGARISVYSESEVFRACSRELHIALINSRLENGIYESAYFIDDGALALQYDMISPQSGISPAAVERVLKDLFAHAEAMRCMAERALRAQ